MYKNVMKYSLFRQTKKRGFELLKFSIQRTNSLIWC